MVLSLVKKILRELVLFIKGVDQAVLEQSVEALEAEYIELENAFLTILLGSLVGVRTVPVLTALEILGDVQGEIKILFSRAVKGEDVLGDLMSSLGGEW